MLELTLIMPALGQKRDVEENKGNSSEKSLTDYEYSSESDRIQGILKDIEQNSLSTQEIKKGVESIISIINIMKANHRLENKLLLWKTVSIMLVGFILFITIVAFYG